MSSSEKGKELSHISGPITEYEALKKGHCLHDLFKIQAKKTPNKIAVYSKGKTLTFKELDFQTDVLAHYLSNDCNLKLDEGVGIFLEKSLEYVICYISIHKAGGCYSPLDINYPKDMIYSILSDYKNKFVAVLTKNKYINNLPKKNKDQKYFCFETDYENLLEKYRNKRKQLKLSEEDFEKWMKKDLKKPDLDNLAYLVFSSGTSGHPKAIACNHRGAVNSYTWRLVNFPYIENERVACNVFFVWELLRPLLGGKTLYVIPGDVIYNPQMLADYIYKHKITRMLFTPSLLLAVMNYFKIEKDGEKTFKKLFQSLTTIWLCGEVVSNQMVDDYLKLFPKSRLLNIYSVSECHDISGADIIKLKSGEEFASTGFIIDNTEIYICDENMNILPKGEIGELYVGGVTLAKFYLNNEKMTKERFIPNPFRKKPILGNDNRLYRTGDLARICEDDSLEIRGRCNSMVKVRGYSIELGSIESYLMEYPKVHTAIAKTLEDKNLLEKKVIGYVECDDDCTGFELVEFLQKKLPQYSIPSVFMRIDKTILQQNTVSGKADYSKLPHPKDKPSLVMEIKKSKALKEPKNKVEKELLQIWNESFGFKKNNINMTISVDDTFQSIGGNSFIMAKLYNSINKKYKKIFQISQLFSEYNSIEKQGKAISNKKEIKEKKIDYKKEIQTQFDELEKFKLENSKSVLLPLQQYENILKNQLKKHKILITGTTGFLGAFLLRDLLEIFKNSEIYCIVRLEKQSKEEAFKKIKKNLMFYKCWNDEYEKRIKCVISKGPHGIALKYLGVEEKEYNKLCEDIDLIIHNAANVNFTLDYSNLKETNVISTINAVKLALSKKVKPFFYVSSNGVFPIYKKNRVVQNFKEDEPSIDINSKFDPSIDLTNGYCQSKYVSESIIYQMKKKYSDLPIVIFRPGDISGDSINGISNMNHDFVRFIQGIIKMEKAPVDYRFIDLDPVDLVSKSIISYNSLTKKHFTFNLIHPSPIRICDVISYIINTVGYSNIKVSNTNKEWLELLRNSPDNPLTPLLFYYETNMNHDDCHFENSLWKNIDVPTPQFILGKIINFLIKEKYIEPPKKNPVFGKTAIVFGGSSGIGNKIGEKLVSKGCKVCFCARSEEKLKLICQNLEKKSKINGVGQSIYYVADVTSKEQVQKAVEFTENKFSSEVDIIALCAGLMTLTKMENCLNKMWDKMIDVNVKGILNGISAVLPKMIKRNSGDIIAISSNAGRDVWENLTVYSGSKFAVEAIMKGLKNEVNGTKIRVTSIQPGDVKTNLLNHDNPEKGSVKDYVNDFLKKQTILEPEDIAEAAYFALSQPRRSNISEILVEPHF